MITKIIQEELIQKAKKYVERGERFVIVTHVSPDGDALGSSLGLCHFLNAYGKDKVYVVVPNCARHRQTPSCWYTNNVPAIGRNYNTNPNSE